MRKQMIVAAVAAAMLCLSGCSQVDAAKEAVTGKPAEETNTVKTKLTGYEKGNLTPDQFYIKKDNLYYPIYMGETNIPEEDRCIYAGGVTKDEKKEVQYFTNRIPDTKEYKEVTLESSLIAATAADDRIITLTKDEVMIPVLDKDSELVYVSNTNIPTFTWERFKDCGYSIGMYNMQENQSGKVEFVIGTSKTDHNSTAFQKLSQMDLSTGTILLNSMNERKLTGEDLTEAGSISGLAKGEEVKADLYIGTIYNNLSMKADTKVLSSEELYYSKDYTLSQEGYAKIEIPTDMAEGYYLVNGLGVFAYKK